MHQFLAQVTARQGDHAGQHRVADDGAEVGQLVWLERRHNVHEQMSRSREVSDRETPHTFVRFELVPRTPVSSTDTCN